MPLKNIEFSSLSSLKVIGENNHTIGRIKDAIIDKKRLSVRGFIIHGSRFEETLETLKLIVDVDPLLYSEDIMEITNNTIKLNKNKEALINAKEPGEIQENEILFSQLKKLPVYESTGIQIGNITNFYLDEFKNIKYKLGGKIFIKFLNKNLFTTNISYLISPDQLILSSDKYTENGECFEFQSNLQELEQDIKLNMTNILRELLFEALSDGKITAEEKDLIDVVSVDLSTYYDTLERAMEDNIITKDEEKQLDAIKEKIIKKMHVIARADNQITKDEQALIRKVAAYMIDKRNELFWSVFSG